MDKVEYLSNFIKENHNCFDKFFPNTSEEYKINQAKEIYESISEYATTLGIKLIKGKIFKKDIKKDLGLIRFLEGDNSNIFVVTEKGLEFLNKYRRINNLKELKVQEEFSY